MELFLFRHAEYERLYNCTAFPIDSVPLERRRQFVAGGIAKCVFCAIYYVLYVPCMYSIWKHFHENSCYKLLFYIGIADLGILWILGFFSGWLCLSGGVFCSSPTLMYLVGVTVLALNRCLELGFAKLCRLLFSGHRIYAWLFACSLYALGRAVFVKPVLYSSLFFGWFYDPFVGYRTADQLQQREEVFIQVLLISSMNTLTCSLYVYFQSHEVGQWMITLAEFSWLHLHGFPPVIYLTLNKTIRSDCRLLYMKLFKRNRIGHIGGVTVVRSNLMQSNGREAVAALQTNF
ncbi:hypothetical protein niasHT_038910 [Heterodera trifolii]|uniref:Uncharacterized protein n=1 Tax=Heterodera trifolii TaxID=157864 RepID=A0ABD2IM05_9BILA